MGDLSLLKLLVEEGYGQLSSPIYAALACYYERPEILQYLIESGAPVDRDVLGCLIFQSLEPEKGEEEGEKTKQCLNILLKAGVDRNWIIEEGCSNTALHILCQKVKTKEGFDLIALLLDNKSVNAKNFYQFTPLHYICGAFCFQMGLLTVEGELEREQNYLSEWREVITKMVKDYYCDVNAQDLIGQTPLHHTAQLNNPEYAKLLIDLGAKMKIKEDRSGFTPLDRARELKSTAVVKVLEDAMQINQG